MIISTLLALVVSASVPPQIPPGPLGPVSANGVPDGITVRGSGNAQTPADEATLTLRLFSRPNSPAITEASLQPVVDALMKAGVAKEDITTPAYLTGSATTTNAAITAVVHHPTVAMIQNGVAALAGEFPPGSSVSLSGADVRLTAEDCSAARAQAQSAAIRAARANAESIARNLAVRVGQVLAVDYQSGPFDQGGTCSYTYNLGPYQSSLFTTPEEYLRVRVTSSVTIRYAIK